MTANELAQVRKLSSKQDTLAYLQGEQRLAILQVQSTSNQQTILELQLIQDEIKRLQQEKR